MLAFGEGMKAVYSLPPKRLLENMRALRREVKARIEEVRAIAALATDAEKRAELDEEEKALVAAASGRGLSQPCFIGGAGGLGFAYTIGWHRGWQEGLKLYKGLDALLPSEEKAGGTD